MLVKRGFEEANSDVKMSPDSIVIIDETKKGVVFIHADFHKATIKDTFIQLWTFKIFTNKPLMLQSFISASPSTALVIALLITWIQWCFCGRIAPYATLWIFLYVYGQ